MDKHKLVDQFYETQLINLCNTYYMGFVNKEEDAEMRFCQGLRLLNIVYSKLHDLVVVTP